jgi:hypothetical protein
MLVVTGTPVSSILVHASWVDLGPSTQVSPNSQNTPITTAATTTIVPAPPAGVDRNVKFFSINNTSGSDCAVTVQITDGVNTVNMFGPITLHAGWMIQYNSDGSGTVVYDNKGNIQVSPGDIVIISITNLNVSAGTTSNNLASVVFSNSNGVSFGLNGSTVTASVNTGASLNISAGTTSNNLTAVTFADGGGISFGLNGSVITATGGVGNASVFSQDADFVTHFPISQGALSLQKLSLPMNVSATELALIADFKGFSNSTDAVTISHAVYTLSAGTARLASSGSRAISWGLGSNTAVSTQYGGASGTRYRTLGISYAMTPGDYVFGWWFSTANGAIVNAFGRAAMNLVGTFDGVETNTFLNGVSTATVVAFPASFAATDTGYVRTGFSALRQPGAILFGT